jgi:hypothetical protein
VCVSEFQRFLDSLKGDISGKRKNIVLAAYQKIDLNRLGSITLD